MNNVDKIMRQLRYLNQLARGRRAEEKTGFGINIYLIKETESTVLTYSKDGDTLSINYKQRDIIWNEENEVIKTKWREIIVRTELIDYNEFKSLKRKITDLIYSEKDLKQCIEKVNQIRDNHFDSTELYNYKSIMIERLYKLGLLTAYEVEDHVLFEYLDREGYHLPLETAEKFLDVSTLDKYIKPVNNNTHQERRNPIKRPIKNAESYIRITHTEVLKLYDEVMNL